MSTPSRLCLSLLASGLLFWTLPFLSMGVVRAQTSRSVCWTPEVLNSRPGEKTIRHTAYNSTVEPSGAPVNYQPIPSEFRGSIRRVDLPHAEKLVAFTFDLCENGNEISGYDSQIVDTLRAKGAKATFFPSGKWLADHDERGQQLMADPLFEVGAHSWTHRNFRLLPADEVKQDVDLDLKEDRIIRERLHARSCYRANGAENTVSARPPLFRFPFGTCNEQSLNAVNDAGLLAVQWDVVSADPSPAQSAEAIRKAVVNAARSGSIVVMHGNGRGWHTSEALPLLIDDLRKRGFEFATVSELLQKGKPVIADSCYEVKPGDNARYDKLFPLAKPPRAKESSQAPVLRPLDRRAGQ